MNIEIIFNNGKICGFDDIGNIPDGTSGTVGDSSDLQITIRDGYQTKKTTDGYILVPQT